MDKDQLLFCTRLAGCLLFGLAISLILEVYFYERMIEQIQQEMNVFFCFGGFHHGYMYSLMLADGLLGLTFLNFYLRNWRPPVRWYDLILWSAPLIIYMVHYILLD